MHKIELYVGTRDDQNRSERVALRRVVEILTASNVSAVIISSVWLDKKQIDLLVGTETTTLQLEVKGFRNKIIGAQNGDWIVDFGNGRTATRKNGYLQALANNQKLRNHMARILDYRCEVSYPNGAVLFEGNIPAGSGFEIPRDERVLLCGVEQLDELLARPSPNPWPLEWLREFARAKRLTEVDPYNPFPASRRAIPARTAARLPQKAVASASLNNGLAPAPIQQEALCEHLSSCQPRR
jgi:hypothetical protein